MIKKLLKVFSFVALIALPFISVAQNISGIINTYTAVTSIVGTTISVTSAAGFSVGGKVLVIQMKGATITQANNNSYGDILAYNNAGNYEYATVTAVNGNNISIQSPLCRQYTIADLVQLITVPQYVNPTVTAILLAQDWNGTTGGVLVFEATGTVTLNADIDVSGNGFIGGATCLAGFGCNNTNYFLGTGSGGIKGESIAQYIAGQQGGMGKLANGGGGGNPGNCGGGGGGNFGSGGIGGNEYSGCGSSGIQGVGGSVVSNTGSKIFLGGGGGGGFSDNSQSVTPGTDGGGIVMITANAFDGNNFFIRSDAPDQTLVANDESAGGGGSGGTILLAVPNFLSTTNITTNGGDGGNTYNNIFTGDCHGPGGGGGGGLLWISGASLPAAVNYSSNAGQPGLVQNPSSSCYNTTYGAAAGSNGGVLLNLPGVQLLVPVDLGNDTSLCPSQAVVLDAGAGYATYLWNDGSTNETVSALLTGVYAVTVTTGAGCSDIDTVTLSLLPPIVFTVGNDTTVCPHENVLVNAGNGFAGYLWNDGSISQTFVTNDSGWATVTVADTLGCLGKDSLMVNWYVVAQPDLGNDTSFCVGSSHTFDAGTGNISYLWSDGSTNVTLTTATTGLYSVTVTDVQGCSAQAAGNILGYFFPPELEMNDTIICPGTPVFVHSPAGNLQNTWSDSSTFDSFIATLPGVYWLTVTTNQGCSTTDSFELREACPVLIYFPNAFSPNNDGVNDEFFPFDFNVSEFHLRIYNRWGQLVFASDNLDEHWDGTVDNVPCSMGVYIYSAVYSGISDGALTSGELKGNVTLLK